MPYYKPAFVPAREYGNEYSDDYQYEYGAPAVGDYSSEYEETFGPYDDVEAGSDYGDIGEKRSMSFIRQNIYTVPRKMKETGWDYSEDVNVRRSSRNHK